MSYREALFSCQPVDRTQTDVSPDSRAWLAPLLAPLSALSGIGPKLAGLLKRAVGGDRVLDVLFHLPESYIDRRERPSIRAARPGQVATLSVEVVRHEKPETPRQPWRAVVGDGTGFLELVYFSRGAWAEKLPVGARVIVSGRIEGFASRLAMHHPEHVLPLDREAALPLLDPVWRMTAGLPGHVIRRAVVQALARLPPLPEWQDEKLLRQQGWTGFAAALAALQAPTVPPDLRVRARLAYDELLANQVALGLLRQRERSRPGRRWIGDGHFRDQAREKFGFELTATQLVALGEIDADLAAPWRMLRLLQGDVGAGKTVVAVLAMLRVVEGGGQAALMVPTEVLAGQHFRTLQRVSPVPVALLTGSVKGVARRQILARLADGSIRLIVGTHALFQEGVAYHDLGLAVIDEQHRFGVDQRLRLGAKGHSTDLLVMTATPIPRTLLMTQWNEMAVSRLTGKPAGRPAIRTTLHALAALADVCDAVARALDRGAHVYWVCPLVAETEGSDLAAAEARFATLAERFSSLTGLAHGQQDPQVRDAALADFTAGRVRLLVATTVIEVGVDVAQATVMVIEHAERFGLAQLHQLRGRVGRGTAPSFCLLLHDELTEAGRRRLALLRDTEDGFVIADEDYRLRGGGDVVGTRQSGDMLLRLGDPEAHAHLLTLANRDAAGLLAEDPQLTSERGVAIRKLLALFGKDEPERTLQAG